MQLTAMLALTSSAWLGHASPPPVASQLTRKGIDWAGNKSGHEEITRSLLQNATPHLHLTSLHELMSPANSDGRLPLASPPPHCLSHSVTTHQSVTFGARSGNNQKQPKDMEHKLFLFYPAWGEGVSAVMLTSRSSHRQRTHNSHQTPPKLRGADTSSSADLQ